MTTQLDEVTSHQPPLPAGKLARGITVVALLCYCTMTVLNIIEARFPATQLAFGIALACAVFGLQFAITAPAARQWPTRRTLAVLGCQAALTYAPLALYGNNWGSMEGPLAASVLLALPGRAAWTVYALLVASVPVYTVLLGVSAIYVMYYTISAMLTGLVIYGLSRLTDLVYEVHAAREALARMAVTQERLRFSRDLHDLLGYSLSAIALKGELVRRLIPADPGQARDETVSLLEVARQALADVRLVASGYRDMSLRDEAESAAAVLATAGIRAEMDVGCGRLNPVVDTVLATTLREGVTNVLRHSAVRSCTITAAERDDDATVVLTLVNDGVGEKQKPADGHRCDGQHSDGQHSGSGLANLRSRLAAVGGRLDAGVGADGRFRLRAEIPAEPMKERVAATALPGRTTSGHAA